MALSVVLELVFSEDTVQLNDITGDYSVDNLTGYGAPNAEFTDFGHFAIIRKKNVNSVADEVLTLNSYNPVTAESFEADRSVDGWYEGVKLNIPVWTAGTYDANTVKYYNGSVWMSNTSTSGTPGVSSDWDAITDLTEIEGNTSITTTTESRVTAYNADVYWSQQIATLSQQGKCGICEDERKKERLDKIYRHIQSVLVADQLGNNSDGEWNALALINMGAYES